MKKYIHQVLRAANSITGDGIWPKLKLIQAFIVVLVTCKNEEVLLQMTAPVSSQYFSHYKVSKGAKIRKRYNQVPYLTQDTNGKVTNSQFNTTNESQEVSPFPVGDHKAHINRRAQPHSKHKTEKRSTKRSTALGRSVKYFTGGLKPVSRQ